MENFFNVIDLFNDDDNNNNDTILNMEEGNTVIDEEEEIFDPHDILENVCKTIKEKYNIETITAKEMFYFDMIPIHLDYCDKDIYWLPIEHPYAIILRYNGVSFISQVEENCKFGDVVIHYKEVIDWCVELAIKHNTNNKENE